MKRHYQAAPHIIGGVALTNGVLLHAPDVAVVALRTHDGEVMVEHWQLPHQKPLHTFLQLPGIRGLWLLWRTVVWNSRMRAFVGQAARQMEHPTGDAKKGSSGQHHQIPPSLFPSLGLLAAFLLYAECIMIFRLVSDVMVNNMPLLQSDVLTFLLTFLLLVYIVRRFGIWEYMGYHGAEHQAIQAFEDGKRTFEAVEHAWPYQPRCGAAVVSYVAVLLAITGYFWPTISFLASIPLAVVLFSLSYEIVLVLDRYHDQMWARLLSTPGVLLQFLVARHPRSDQSEVATKALFELTHLSKTLKAHSAEQGDLALT